MVHGNAPTGYEEQRDTTEARKTPPAPTAATITQEKDLQNEEIFDGRYAVDVYKPRSIKPSPRAIARNNTDRTISP